jgi:hypothetical protein
MTLSIAILSTMGLFKTLDIKVLSAIMLSVVMLNVFFTVMLSVIMLSVVAPQCGTFNHDENVKY